MDIVYVTIAYHICQDIEDYEVVIYSFLKAQTKIDDKQCHLYIELIIPARMFHFQAEFD